MKRFLLSLAILFLVCNINYAQETGGHKISISSNNYDKEYVVIGYYYGDRQLVLDTLTREDNNQFILEGQEPLKEGVYLLLLSPTNRYIQFIVNQEEQEFNIQLDTSNLASPEISGSKDNQLFLDYVSFLNEKGASNQTLIEQIKAKKAAGQSVIELEDQQKQLDVEVKAYQNQLISDNPSSVTAKMISSTKDVEIPEFTGSEEEVKTQQYLYYKSHYFDNLNLGDSTLLRTPFMHNKIDSYLNKLTPQSPDSINLAIDFLLKKMEPAPETFQFYLSHFLNTYAASKIVGFDGIYVHLIDNYYAKGKADWVEEENLIEIIKQANKIRPTLLGKTGQDIKVYQKDKSAISLSDIESKYLLLYFWAPDCGHCKKATPHVVEFYKKYKDSLGVDLEILAVCTKIRDEKKEAKCWESVEEKGMDLWINASDLNHSSRFKVKYNVETTPSIFILNEEREIIMKRIGAEYLDEVMQEIIRVDDQNAIEEQLKE